MNALYTWTSFHR